MSPERKQEKIPLPIDCAFSGCSGLESITVADGNKTYHSSGNCLIETSSKRLILGCKNSLIPTDDSVTSIGDWAFCECSELTSVTIPDSVTSIGEGTFEGCESLTSVTIGNGVTLIGDWAFCRCSELTSIAIPDNVTSIGSSAFYYCSSLTSLTFENTSGWSAGGTNISSEDLADPATAAKYLTDTYRYHYWKRS